MRLRFATVLLLCACTKSTTPSPATESPPPTVPEVVTPASEDAKPEDATAEPEVAATAPPDVAANRDAVCVTFDPARPLGQLAYKDGKLELCHDEGRTTCFAYDLGTRTLTRREPPLGHDVRVDEIAGAGAGLRIHRLDRKAERCDGAWTHCTRLDLAGKTPLGGNFDASGKHLLLFTGGGGEVPSAAVFDGDKRVAQFDIATDTFGCARADLLDGAVFASRGDCAGPGGEAELYTLQGKSLGRIASYPVVHAPAADGWAFVEGGGLEVVVRSLTDGTILRSIDLRPNVAKNSAGEPAAIAAGAFAVGTNRVLVVLDGASQGKLIEVDTAQGTVASVSHLPRCP